MSPLIPHPRIAARRNEREGEMVLSLIPSLTSLYKFPSSITSLFTTKLTLVVVVVLVRCHLRI
jgi:hypothetical protein